MKESLELKSIFNATAEQLFNAWLDSKQHTSMTGGEAVCSNEEGKEFSAWDGYISGSNTSLTPYSEIVQSWRTTEFPTAAEDSHLVVRFKEVNDACEVTLIHTNIPEGQTQYLQGWKDHYFDPMRAYFQ